MSFQDILTRLESLDLGQMRETALAEIRSGKKTKRQRGVKLLRAVDGLQRAGVEPKDLVIRKVPVLPPGFRPYTTAGNTFIPGDANELYSDLIKAVRLQKEQAAVFGPQGTKGVDRYIRQAVRSTYGYEDSPNPKIAARKVSGLLTKILGGNPKTSWVQQKLLAKPQDFVGRGVISPDPELGMDEAGIPESMAWNLFDTQVRRALTAQGIPTSRALQLIHNREGPAKLALIEAMKNTPVMLSRAPAWHKHNYVSAYAKITDGDNVKISPFITAGQGADFDGDTIAVHAPIMPRAVEDAKTILLPSKMLFSVRNRDSTLPQPKHEALLGLAASQLNPSDKIRVFKDQASALEGIRSGAVRLHDKVEISDSPLVSQVAVDPAVAQGVK